MKTIFYIMIALFMGANFTSCSIDNLEETEELHTDVLATEGEDPEIEDEDEG